MGAMPTDRSLKSVAAVVAAFAVCRNIPRQSQMSLKNSSSVPVCVYSCAWLVTSHKIMQEITGSVIGFLGWRRYTVHNRTGRMPGETVQTGLIDDDPDKSTFEYDGVSKFVPCEDNPEFYKLDQSGVTYRCNVKVNLKNIDRFIRNEHMKKYALEHPHELYEIKAKYLYHKIKCNYIECFWD